MLKRSFIALALLAGCASSDPFADLSAAQRRLDERGLGFGVTRVPGYDAFVFQLRVSTSEAQGEAAPDPAAAALAAAPPGCTVRGVTALPDGVSYRAEYQC